MRKLLLAFLLLSFSALADVPATPVLPPPAGPASPKDGKGAPDDASDFADLGREMEDFHKQAQKMLEGLEQATGAAEKAGQSPSQLDVARKKAMRLASDDRFLQSVGELWNNPNRNTMLLAQLGFFLLMLILKAWRQSRALHWFRKLLIGFAFTVVTWVGLLYVIPLIVLGEAFAVFTGTLFKVFVAG